MYYYSYVEMYVCTGENSIFATQNLSICPNVTENLPVSNMSLKFYMGYKYATTVS